MGDNIESAITSALSMSTATASSEQYGRIDKEDQAELNIKFRLRNNRGKTPKKLCKDSTSASNVKILKKSLSNGKC